VRNRHFLDFADRSRRTTSAGNLNRLGCEGDPGRGSRSKGWARTRNSVAISINASFVRISLLSRASLRQSSPFFEVASASALQQRNVSHKPWQKLAALKGEEFEGA
jgi:hypothetical protein